MIEKGINCPQTSSAGRLFDAVSALLDICLVAEFDAEGPIRLEAVAAKDVTESYSYNIDTYNLICENQLREFVNRFKAPPIYKKT